MKKTNFQKRSGVLKVKEHGGGMEKEISVVRSKRQV